MLLTPHQVWLKWLGMLRRNAVWDELVRRRALWHDDGVRHMPTDVPGACGWARLYAANAALPHLYKPYWPYGLRHNRALQPDGIRVDTP